MSWIYVTQVLVHTSLSKRIDTWANLYFDTDTDCGCQGSLLLHQHFVIHGFSFLISTSWSGL